MKEFRKAVSGEMEKMTSTSQIYHGQSKNSILGIIISFDSYY